MKATAGLQKVVIQNSRWWLRVVRIARTHKAKGLWKVLIKVNSLKVRKLLRIAVRTHIKNRLQSNPSLKI